MKKAVIVLLAVFLALPAVGFAGSATSRWDMSIGGYVKFDLGYNTQGAGQNINMAERSGYGQYENLNDKYGSIFLYSGETTLNFLVNGPEAWGAKTSAFVEGYFGGQWIGQGSGTFGLRHGFMQFDWPNSKLTIGQTWNKWGLLPTFGAVLLGYNNLGPFLKGMTQPLVRFEQTLGKNWQWSFGALSPTNTLGSNVYSGSTGAVDSYSRSGMPFWEGSFGFTSDKCGNIGPWRMLFALEGFYGRQKQIAALAASSNSTGTYSASYTDKDVDAWGISFKGFVPIIPEKKGNKEGALSLSGVVYYSQNPGWFMSPTTAGPVFNGNYSYSGTYSTAMSNGGVLLLTADQMAALNYSSPVVYGGWGQVSYYITDKLFVNGWYGYTRSKVSDAWRLYGSSVANGNSANGDAMVNTTQIIGNVTYDVNAAIRMGFEYTWYNTRYANYAYSGTTIVGAKDGTAQSFRVGAYYFF